MWNLKEKYFYSKTNSYNLKNIYLLFLINKYTNNLKQSLKLKTIDCTIFVLLLNDIISLSSIYKLILN